MTVYVPNQGEKEMLKNDLLLQAVILGLYGNVVVPDGSTLVSTLTELLATGGAGYAEIPLNNVLNESAPATGQWYISTDANGKASAQYGLASAPQTWTFNSVDVANAPTVQGIFAYTLVLPFTSGLQPIKVGDVIRQGAVCAEVTGVNVTSGSWAAGNAAGDLYIKRQVGTFVAGATLVDVSRATATSEIKVLTATPVNGGTGYAVGDRFVIGTGTGGVGRVTAVTGGVVTAVELLTGGKDYTVATQATTKIDGAGDNALTVAVASLYTAGPAVAIATIAGDSNKKIMWTEAFSTGTLVAAVGQQINYLPIFTLASA
jgi:hypothetical protein